MVPSVARDVVCMTSDDPCPFRDSRQASRLALVRLCAEDLHQSVAMHGNGNWGAMPEMPVVSDAFCDKPAHHARDGVGAYPGAAVSAGPY